MHSSVHRLRWCLLISCLSFVFVSTESAYATNGYFLIGYGAKSRAMGGTGIAYTDRGSMAAALNPANLSVAKQFRFDVGADLMVPRRAAFHNSETLRTDEISGSNLFLFPSLSFAAPINERFTFGFASIVAGANSRYDQSPDNPNGSFFNFTAASRQLNNLEPLANNTVGINFAQLQLLPSLAFHFNDNHAVGLSVALAVQSIRAYGLGAFEALNYTQAEDHVTDKGNDWAYGAGLRLGWISHLFQHRVSLGAYYASRVYMTEFDDYRNLIAEQGDFDIPAHFGLGIAVHPTQQLSIAADVAHIQFDKIAALANLGPPPEDPTGFFPTPLRCDLHCLGNDQGLGFGWQDTTIYKIGLRYQVNNRWALLAGYNYAKSPIRSNQLLFNLLSPATVEDHATLGLSYQLNKRTDISFNYVHAFKKTLTGTTPFYPAGVTNFSELSADNAAISMYQHSVGITIGHEL